MVFFTYIALLYEAKLPLVHLSGNSYYLKVIVLLGSEFKDRSQAPFQVNAAGSRLIPTGWIFGLLSFVLKNRKVSDLGQAWGCL